jgi:hypothetical protein
MAHHPGPRKARPECKLSAGHPTEAGFDSIREYPDPYFIQTRIVTWVARFCGP